MDDPDVDEPDVDESLRDSKRPGQQHTVPEASRHAV